MEDNKIRREESHEKYKARKNKMVNLENDILFPNVPILGVLTYFDHKGRFQNLCILKDLEYSCHLASHGHVKTSHKYVVHEQFHIGTFRKRWGTQLNLPYLPFSFN